MAVKFLMGDHAEDTMECWDAIEDHYIGDGGPEDRSLDLFARGTLRAQPEQVVRGMEFQRNILDLLGSNWMESRRLLLIGHFNGRSEDQLSPYEFSQLNYLESISGDLIDPINGVSIECQTGVSGPDVSWEHSKRIRSKAKWQCFGFVNKVCLIIETQSIRNYLDKWNVEPKQSLRKGGGPFYSFGEIFLHSIGAIDIIKWKNIFQDGIDVND